MLFSHEDVLTNYREQGYVNQSLGVSGACEQSMAVRDYLKAQQDRSTGLWSQGTITAPYTPAIMRAFHFLRTTWNAANLPYPSPSVDRMIEICLVATRETAFFSWEHGYACTDLDLAFLFYSARCWSVYRREEVAAWARQHLPMVLEVQQDDGGFSFWHTSAMAEHAGIAMSPRRAEGDMWGTLMYLGAIKMLVALAYPQVEVPWLFSRVHCVPCGPLLT